MILLRGKVGHRRLHGPYQSQLVGPSLFLGLYFALTHSHEICRIYCLPLCKGCDSMMAFLEYVGFGLNEGGLELLFVVFKS